MGKNIPNNTKEQATHTELQHSSFWRMKEMMRFVRKAIMGELTMKDVRIEAKREPELVAWEREITTSLWPEIEHTFIEPYHALYTNARHVILADIPTVTPAIITEWMEVMKTIKEQTYACIDSRMKHTLNKHGILAISVLENMRHNIGNLLSQFSAYAETLSSAIEREEDTTNPLFSEAYCLQVQAEDADQAWEALLASKGFNAARYIGEFEVFFTEQVKPASLKTLLQHTKKRTQLELKQLDTIHPSSVYVDYITNELNNSYTQKVIPHAIMLSEVVCELVCNAAKVLKQQNAEAEILVFYTQAEAELWIEIRDEGPGSGSNTPEELFTNGITNTRAFGGTGQGLGKVRKDIAEILHGTLSAYNNAERPELLQEKGMTFEIKIPLVTQ